MADPVVLESIPDRFYAVQLPPQRHHIQIYNDVYDLPFPYMFLMFNVYRGKYNLTSDTYCWLGPEAIEPIGDGILCPTYLPAIEPSGYVCGIEGCRDKDFPEQDIVVTLCQEFLLSSSGPSLYYEPSLLPDEYVNHCAPDTSSSRMLRRLNYTALSHCTVEDVLRWGWAAKGVTMYREQLQFFARRREFGDF